MLPTAAAVPAAPGALERDQPAPQATAVPRAVQPPQTDIGGVTPAPSTSGRLTPDQMARVEADLGKAPARRIGGRGSKPGATYRSGKFAGMTQGQAYERAVADAMRPGGGAAPNSTGGRAAPYSQSNGTMGTGQWGLDAYQARQGTRLADDLGLTRTPASAVRPTAPPSNPVADFRRSLAQAAVPAPPTAPAMSGKPQAPATPAAVAPPKPKKPQAA